ncbi:LysR family transcriptional regulator [Acinetobacter nosocomialis]|uniref:LysR family transcriptional regulator n=1 Tax=Acinetobacter nosocomialis TaxID=106654 RepID=UPI0002D729AD|nr:LysR family transcriptional regulator [Acinetobacter nosocomialis]AWL18772.1 LysR family transcriptional regulator [Acinetobacter nosocomialis]
METLSNLESFIRSAENGSFSAAARHLALTPAAVSRNVAQLEQNLGVRLFHRSTRNLTLTEAGEHFFTSIRDNLNNIQTTISEFNTDSSHPKGTLKISLSAGFGVEYILPLMPDFMNKYPDIKLEWHLSNKQVNLITDNFDAAIGSGFKLGQGIIKRSLSPLHMIIVASPNFLKNKILPSHPEDISNWDGIIMRSPQTGKLHEYKFIGPDQGEAYLNLNEKLIADDPSALHQGAVLGMGIAAISTAHAKSYIENGTLIRILPEWYADLGETNLYFSSKKHMPAKTRCFIDFIVSKFEQLKINEQLSAHKLGK